LIDCGVAGQGMVALVAWSHLRARWTLVALYGEVTEMLLLLLEVIVVVVVVLVSVVEVSAVAVVRCLSVRRGLNSDISALCLR